MKFSLRGLLTCSLIVALYFQIVQTIADRDAASILNDRLEWELAQLKKGKPNAHEQLQTQAARDFLEAYRRPADYAALKQRLDKLQPRESAP